MKNIVGHAENTLRFEKAVERNRLPSTFLFVGPEGIGKKTFAIELAKSLLCESIPETVLENCGHCESCVMIDSGNHPDFEFVCRPKGKANLLIEQFIGDGDHRNRAGLCYNFSLKPNRGTRKVAVIDDADYFNGPSANCLLKILEEPPDRSVLILIGTAADKIMSTIRSRSQIFHFNRLPEDEVIQILQTFDNEDLPASIEEIARAGSGTLMGLRYFREEGLLEFRDLLFESLGSLEPMARKFPKELQGFVEQVGKDNAARRNRLRIIVDFATEFYRTIAVRLGGMNSSGPIGSNKSIEKAVGNWKADAEAATNCIERCMDAYSQIGANANLTTLIEAWLSDLGKFSRGEEIYLSKAESSLY